MVNMVDYCMNNSKQFNISESKVNNIINYLYNELKKLGLSDLKLNSLTLFGCYCLINDNFDLFLDVINSVNIVIENKTTRRLYLNYFKKNMSIGSNGFFCYKYDSINYEEKKYVLSNSTILVGTYNYYGIKSSINFFCDLIHELNHAISYIRDTRYFISDDKFYSRMGLQENIYKKNNSNSIKYNKILNEFYNVYFTDIALNKILQFLKFNINNNNINAYLRLLNNTKLEYNSYSNVMNLCAPLLLNDELTKLVYDTTLNGNINDLYLYFSDYKINLQEFSNNLDSFDSSFGTLYNYKYLEEKIKILSKVR